MAYFCKALLEQALPVVDVDILHLDGMNLQGIP